MGVSASNKARPGSVRIIGGDWRSRRIPVPAGVDLRPTPDRVRETLFSWLNPVLPGSVCLDLFAGTGVLGFEALSRGAARAVFVENHRIAAAALERWQQQLDAEAAIVCVDAMTYLARPTGGPFDIVFVDPPYAVAVEPVLEALPAMLKPGARIYLERARGAAWPATPGLQWIRQTTAGDVTFGLAAVITADPV